MVAMLGEDGEGRESVDSRGCFRACGGGGGGLDVWARAHSWQACSDKKETTYVNTYCSVRGVHSVVASFVFEPIVW